MKRYNLKEQILKNKPKIKIGNKIPKHSKGYYTILKLINYSNQIDHE